MTNPSILRPSQKGIPPLLPFDGPPQRLEGTSELVEGEEAVYAGCDIEQA
jgi:hypothetical protein